MPKKLLLVGSNSTIAHVKSYYNLIEDYFDEVLVVTNVTIDYCDFKIVDFSLKNPIKVFYSIRKLKKIIKNYSPSIIHVHQAGSYSFIASMANNGKLPLVLTTWGSDVLILPQINVLYRFLVKFSLKKADYITADATYMAQAINKMVIKDVLVANFGIDYYQGELPQKKNLIYSNRTHNPLYRIDEIIKGFAKFYTNNSDWKLILGAKGSETEGLKKLANSLLPDSAFEFIGFVNQEENRNQYLAAKIWISYPKSDGTAISLLEAMGYGCIPVVSDLPANKEWITDRKNGIVVKNNIEDSLKLAKGIKLKTVQELNKNIIKSKAIKTVNKSKFEAIYTEIINK